MSGKIGGRKKQSVKITLTFDVGQINPDSDQCITQEDVYEVIKDSVQMFMKDVLYTDKTLPSVYNSARDSLIFTLKKIE